jgi:hypothetical protein
MKSGNHPKKQHEKFVCETLLQIIGLKATFGRYGDDLNEPDCIYRVGEELLGIEVATAYYDKNVAKQKWTLFRGERKFPSQGYEWREGGAELVDLMCHQIQKEINDKCSKKYCGSNKIWLCIQETAEESSESTIKDWIRSIRIPEYPSFDAIYLLHQAPTNEGGNYKAFRIWP